MKYYKLFTDTPTMEPKYNPLLISDKAKKLLQKGEQAYKKSDYNTAKRLYESFLTYIAENYGKNRNNYPDDLLYWVFVAEDNINSCLDLLSLKTVKTEDNKTNNDTTSQIKAPEVKFDVPETDLQSKMYGDRCALGYLSNWDSFFHKSSDEA